MAQRHAGPHVLDVEDDEGKEAEVAFLDAFTARVRTDGIDAAWAPVLPKLAPVIGTLVRDAIPRSDPASIAAAAAIGHDRAFRAVDDLATLTTPALIIPEPTNDIRRRWPTVSPVPSRTANSHP